MDGSIGASGSSASRVGEQTIQGMQLASSALQVLGQYASLPSENYDRLTHSIKNILDGFFGNIFKLK